MKIKLLPILIALLIVVFTSQQNKVDSINDMNAKNDSSIVKSFSEASKNQHNYQKNDSVYLMEFPATCFAPDTDPSVIEEFYSYKNKKANSLGITGSDMKFNIQNRWSFTATNGGGLGQGDITTLTWSYVADGTPIGNGGCGVPGESTNPSDFITFFNGIYGPPSTPGDFTTAPWHALFVDMFNSWSAVSGLIFVYEPNDDGATVVTGGGGVLGIRGDVRISGRAIDGNSGVLACNYFPNNGDMIIDTSDNYYANNPTTGATNVLTHEIGHGLGIAHVCPINQSKLMEPFVTTAFLGPQEDDILATNRSYGDPEGENDTSATASFLGANPNPTSYNKSQRSIDDQSDIDYFSFTISESSTVNVTLTPTGSTYLDGTQNPDGSCSPGTSFNAKTVANLMVEILDADGSTVLATANANGPGQVENTLTSIPVAGTYFVRVQQQDTGVNNVQMYDLDVSMNAGVCQSASVPTNIQASSVTDASAQISWDAQNNVLYDLRYRETGTNTWIVVGDLVPSSTNLTSLSELTEYEVQVRSKCPEETPTVYSSSLFFTTEETPLVYCDSQGNIQDDEFISKVEFASIDNTSAAENGGYSDFTDISTVVVSGNNYPISITPTWTDQIWPEGYAVWIDFNQNGSFEDSDELVFSQIPTTNSPVTGTINIPTTALEGKTRMRVSMKYDGIPDSCETFNWGEVEDYSVEIYHGYVFNDNEWTPEDPSGISTATDNIRVINGATALTSSTEVNHIVVEEGATLSTPHAIKVNGDINNDGEFIFTSNSTSTGQLATFTGNLNGAVEVQRYLPARRAFRLYSSPVTTQTSVLENLQENGASVSGLGTHITGEGGASNGFDVSGSNNPSMFIFDNLLEDQSSGAAWSPVDNTNINTLTAGNPMRLFVRGDRTINLNSNASPATVTTLRAKGNLQIGNFSPIISAFNGNFNLVGNPYQAAVDFKALTITGDINAHYLYVWDPQLNDRGGYATITTSDGSNTVSSNANGYIQPGQAFFIRNNIAVNTPPSIIFTEASKRVDEEQLSPFSTLSVAKLNVQLFSTDGEEQLADGIGFRFSENFNSGIDDSDAAKMGNAGENLASVNNNQLFSIEQREWPNQNEEVQLFINSYESENYRFKLEQENINEEFEIFIKDNYLGTQTLIDAENDFNFSIDPSISDSSSMFRFSLVFEDVSLSNENFDEMDFQIYPNPAKNGAFTIRSKGLNGQEVKLTIYNVLGEEVFSNGLITKPNGQVNIEASDLSSGLYIVELKQEEKRFTRKLIVE